MANNTGAFHIARQLFDSEIWIKKPASWKVIWLYILGRVNHSDSTSFKRGEGFFRFSKELDHIGYDITEDMVKKCLAYLRKKQMISTSRSTRGTRLKVLKYNEFQDLNQYFSTSRGTREARQKHDRSTTIVNNVKNERMIKTSIVPAKKFIKPTKAELDAYCEKMNYNVNTEKWLAHYNSNGWKVGKNPMKSWQSALTTWHLKDAGTAVTQKPSLEIEWYVYWCYHCQEESFKKELGNYRCKKPDCQCEVRGSVEDGNLEEIGAKLEHRRNIFKKEKS